MMDLPEELWDWDKYLARCEALGVGLEWQNKFDAQNPIDQWMEWEQLSVEQQNALISYWMKNPEDEWHQVRWCSSQEVYGG